MCKKHRTRWSVIKDPRFGPLGIYLEAFEKRLSEQGYAQSTIDYKVRIVRHLNKWLHQKRLSIKDLNEQKVTRFLSYWSKSHLIHLGYLSTFKNLLGWLRQSDIVPTPTPKNDHSELGRILQDYRFYLRKERGLTPATLKNYLPKVGRFLFGCFETGAVLRNDLRPKVVMNFLFSQARIYSPRTVQLVATALRSFLRFLRFRGDIGLDLAASVPTVANRGWPDLPKYLQLEDVNQLLKSCDRTCAAGLRDYAILLLIARLGLRAGELLTLSLDDINWEAGIITIHGKGGRQESLPIPKDVGQAIVRYLKRGRPKCSTRRLFVRVRAPFKELARNGCISSVVRYACQRAGLSPPHQGAHLLRHSLATHMLRAGASMAEIAEILRHRSPSTTEIYAKVDLRALSTLAKPWIGGEV